MRGLGHGVSLPKVRIYIINHARKIFTFQVKLRSHLWSECCYMRLLKLINDSENKMTAPECVYAIVYVGVWEKEYKLKRERVLKSEINCAIWTLVLQGTFFAMWQHWNFKREINSQNLLEVQSEFIKEKLLSKFLLARKKFRKEKENKQTKIPKWRKF